MRKISAMIGMPVVCRSRKIGRLVQADISKDLKCLTGIWIDSGLKGTRYIPAEDLEMLGSHSIISECCGRRKRLTSSPFYHRAVSTDGQRLGAVTGAEINEISLSVEALELSSGILEDLVNGRRRVETFTVNRETGEVVIDMAGKRMEDVHYEKWNDKRPDHRNDHRRFGSDTVRCDELADREEMESESTPDRQLDKPQSG